MSIPPADQELLSPIILLGAQQIQLPLGVPGRASGMRKHQKEV
jgi:hypothetical protein